MVGGGPPALMLAVFGAYLLLMSGHTYSPDEETMLAVSRGLLRAGTWEMARNSTLVEVRGEGGRLYSQYGPAQSLAAVPWVAVGEGVGKAFPEDQGEFVLRLILGSYNALVAAGICGVFAALGEALGFGRRVSLLGGGALGFGTFLWPHSRTFFSEPLTGLLLLGAFYLLVRWGSSRGWGAGGGGGRWAAVGSGVLFALAVATKVQYVVGLPAFVLYLCWPLLAGWRGAAGRALRVEAGRRLLPLGWWLAGAALGAVPLMAYNWAAFGGPLLTGYGSDVEGAFRTPLYEGLYGLLFSSGKGLMWFAPPVLLSVWGAGWFGRGRGRGAEAAFVGVLAGCVLVLFGVYTFWHGDGSWGPRYLVPVLPFLMLPGLAAMERAREGREAWARVVVSCVVAAGVVVNVLGSVVNFDSYINIEHDEDTRHYVPYRSPVVGHVDLLRERVGLVRALLERGGSMGAGHVLLESGFSYSEGEKTKGEELPRWTTGRGVMEIGLGGYGGGVTVTLRLSDHRPPSLPRARVDIRVNGAAVGGGVASVEVEGEAAARDYSFAVRGDRAEVRVESDTWNPSKVEAGGGARDEDLGVRLDRVSLRAAGGRELGVEVVDVRPAPAYYAAPRWYYNVDTRFAADWWPVYMVGTGMGRKAMLALGMPLVLVGVVCLVGGIWAMRRR